LKGAPLFDLSFLSFSSAVYIFLSRTPPSVDILIASKMLFKSLTYASVLAVASAQSLTEVLANQTDLSTLNGLLSSQPDLTGQLAGLNNVTILAPSNEALSAFVNSSAGQGLTSDPGLLAAMYVDESV
jgi:hypothetical protein